MILNHIDLCVANVLETRDFFEKCFDFKSVSEKRVESIAILKDDSNFTLVLNNSESNDNIIYPKRFHIGFIVENKDKVIDIYNKVKNYLSDFQSEISENNRGYMFYFYAPGKILVEVSCNKII